MVQRILQHQ
jgi:hypothetical protein